MKKTAVVSINLRKFRPIFMTVLFSFVIMTSVVLSKTLPAITIGEDILRIILSSNISFCENDFPVPCVSSLNKIVSKNENSPVLEEVPVVTRVKTVVPPKTNVTPEVKLSNTTELDIKAEDFLSPTPAFLSEDFSVLIVHTHTTESYTPSEKFSYVPTDTDRTTDKNFNMVRIGKEIKSVLEENGVRVYHDTTINDNPSYSGSYNKSAKAIERHIKKDPSIKIVLDVHRDAVEGKSGEKVKYVANISGENAAKIMFVVGSNQSGLSHDNWENNLRFATQLQSHTEAIYPELCRPLNFRSQRFNQQLAPAGIIVEVGTNGNTLDEAILGARCFAIALCDFIKESKK